MYWWHLYLTQFFVSECLVLGQREKSALFWDVLCVTDRYNALFDYIKEFKKLCHLAKLCFLHAFMCVGVSENLPMQFCFLQCGGIGVDSDTVWNDTHTSSAARMVSITSLLMFSAIFFFPSIYNLFSLSVHGAVIVCWWSWTDGLLPGCWMCEVMLMMVVMLV